MDQQFKYDVCLSFASEQRDYVSKVKDELNKAGLSHFFDEDEQVEMWGKNLNEALDEIYRKTSRFCVMFISTAYAKKMWTIHERRSAQARALIDRSVYLLPARFDDTEIDGLPPIVLYIDLRHHTSERFAQLIIEKVRGNQTQTPRAATSDDNAYKMDEKDRQCLKDLRTTDPRDDKARIEENKGGLLEDSYRWILENADYRQWRDDQQSPLLWIKGDPGKGKTMLLCGIINELKKSTVKTGLLSFFFCEGTDMRINNAMAVLRGLIYLLIDQQPSLIRYIREKYDHADKELFEDTNAWIALSGIFINILQDPSLKNAYLIIDALDECQTEDLPKLLDFIVQKSSASPHVKWIVSSRNWRKIEERLEAAEQKVRLSLELNAESISTAVSTYIEYKVLHLARLKNYDDKTRDAVRDHLSSNANNTFLWVALVCQSLEKISCWNTLMKLDAFPAGLDPLYRRMMEQVCNSDDSNLCKRILAIITVVYRPITLKELAAFIGMLEIASNIIESLAGIIGLCGSFLTLRECTVHFVHQSAKDFLLEKASDEIFIPGIGDVHYTIFSRSLKIMNTTLRRDMYGLCAPGFPIDEVEQPDPDPLAVANYSCVYWIDHLCDWDSSKSAKHSDDIQDGGAVDRFMRQKYLYWLEALSICRSMSEGVISYKWF